MGKPLAAANIVDDPVLFVQSALSDIEPEKFEFVEGFPVLIDANGWVLFGCQCKKREKISAVELSPVSGKINNLKIKPVNRGFNAVIEATVLATRYVLHRENKLIGPIDYYSTIMKQ